MNDSFNTDVNRFRRTLSESLLERRNAAHKGLGNNGVDKGALEMSVTRKDRFLDSQISMLRRKQS